MLMSRAVDDLVTKTPGKRLLAVEAFARALRALPTTLADNGGYDSSDLIAQLRTFTLSLLLPTLYHGYRYVPRSSSRCRRFGHHRESQTKTSSIDECS